MWLSLFCLLLIAGIAFFQSIHGLVSSLIFCVLTIVCTAFAFAVYEYVAYSMLLSWKPDYAHALALALSFGVPLLILRVIMDQLIRRSNLIPAWADRAGGIVFGALTSLLIVGVLVTAIQMLPFGGSFIGFVRFDRPPERKSGEEEKWNEKMEQEAARRMREGDDHRILLSPDRFTVAFASMLSHGVFSGERPFSEDHPDLLVEVGWSQATFADCRKTSKPDAVQVQPLHRVDYIYKKTWPTRENPQSEYDPVDPRPGREFWVANITPGSDTQDSDGNHRYTLPQIRLLGADPGGRAAQYIPIAVRDQEDAGKHIHESVEGRNDKIAVLHLWTPASDGTIEVVFEVPKGFEPRLLAYKVGGQVPVTAPRGDDYLPPPPDTEESEASSSGTGRNDSEASASSGGRGSGGRSTNGRGGRVSGARARQNQSFFSDRLPNDLVLTDYTSSELEVQNEVLESGSVVAVLAFQGEKDTQPHISRFKVPDGKRLLHLSVNVLRARSTLGRALSFSVQTVRNYLVTDDAGQQYQMVGQYAIAYVDTDDMVEIQYNPEAIGSMGRGSGAFREIKQRHLEQPDTSLVYLYLIDKGRKVVRFTTGTAANSAVDLDQENLVAE